MLPIRQKDDRIAICFVKIFVLVKLLPKPIKHLLILSIEHMSSTCMKQ